MQTKRMVVASQPHDCGEHPCTSQLTCLDANTCVVHILQLKKATVSVSLLLEGTPPSPK